MASGDAYLLICPAGHMEAGIGRMRRTCNRCQEDMVVHPAPVKRVLAEVWSRGRIPKRNGYTGNGGEPRRGLICITCGKALVDHEGFGRCRDRLRA